MKQNADLLHAIGYPVDRQRQLRSTSLLAPVTPRPGAGG